jgi:hypothetical protein
VNPTGGTCLDRREEEEASRRVLTPDPGAITQIRSCIPPAGVAKMRRAFLVLALQSVAVRVARFSSGR